MQPTQEGPSLESLATGLIFAVAVGAAVIPVLKRIVERAAGLDEGDRGRRVPSWVTGLVERLLFTVVIAYNISGAFPGMMAWVALKMGANWNSAEAQMENEGTKPPAREILNRRFTALIASAVAMGISIIGGLIGATRIPITAGLVWVSGTAIASAVAGHFILIRADKVIEVPAVKE
jgi:hypothetical protein